MFKKIRCIRYSTHREKWQECVYNAVVFYHRNRQNRGTLMLLSLFAMLHYWFHGTTCDSEIICNMNFIKEKLQYVLQSSCQQAEPSVDV